MKIGKVPENVLRRSVFQQISHRRPEVLLYPAVGEDCAAVVAEEGEVFVCSSDPITAAGKRAGTFAVHITANDLASSGAEPVGILLTVLLPPGAREKRLTELMQEAEIACKGLDMEIMGGHTEVTDAVNRIVLMATGIGKVKKQNLVSTAGLHPGDELVMTKWAGLEGTAIIAGEKREKLLGVLPEELVDTAASFYEFLSVVPEAKIAVESGVSAMHDVTEGGIFGALWEMGAASGVGIFADLKKIPIRQETIEVCEVFGINPYRMMSSGSMLIGCKNGNFLADRLLQAGIPAAVIGRATDGNDRIVVNGGETRFLEPTGSDELYKIN